MKQTFKYLDSIALWTESGKSYEEIVMGLSERSDDECYSAFHWIENMAAKAGGPSMFPEVAFIPGDHLASERVLSFMSFPEGTPAEVKELVAMAVEHMKREGDRATGKETP